MIWGLWATLIVLSRKTVLAALPRQQINGIKKPGVDVYDDLFLPVQLSVPGDIF